MRPASRGTTGAAGGAGDWGGGGAPRLGTGARLGTGMRPGTGSTGAAGGRADVTVTDRPVTQGGISGMRLSTADGRRVQDVTYYQGLLRGKIATIAAEINKLKGDIEQCNKDTTTYNTLERQYETMIKAVRSLEGDLADYNLAMDKSRTGTEAGDITQYYLALKQRNEYEEGEIDKVFLMRQDRERQVAELEAQMRAIQDKASAKLQRLPKESHAEYLRLVEENSKLSSEISQQQAQLETINSRVAEAEEHVSRDTSRQDAQQYQNQLSRMQTQLTELQTEARASRADPAELRERLFARTKAESDRLVSMQATHKQVMEECEAKRKAIADLDMDLDERRDEGGESQKYEKLYARDQEMTEFIESFPNQKAQSLAEKATLQRTVVALLEHISLELERQANLPTADHVRGLEEDTAAKGTELEHAQNTKQHLESELLKRQQELEKIATLDSKIGVELTTLAEKMTSMNAGMVTYAAVDMLKVEHERVTAMLEQKRAAYLRRFDMVRLQVNGLSSRYERLKSAVAGSETAKALEGHEQKIRHYEQSIFAMREFVETKGRESEYATVREECNRMVDDVNTATVKIQAAMRPTMAATPY